MMMMMRRHHDWGRGLRKCFKFALSRFATTDSKFLIFHFKVNDDENYYTVSGQGDHGGLERLEKLEYQLFF